MVSRRAKEIYVRLRSLRAFTGALPVETAHALRLEFGKEIFSLRHLIVTTGENTPGKEYSDVLNTLADTVSRLGGSK